MIYITIDKARQEGLFIKRKVKPCQLIFKNFFYLFRLCWIFAALLGLFSICGKLGLLFVEVHSLLTAVDSLVIEHGF